MLKEKAFTNVIAPSKTHRIFGQYVIKHWFQFKYAAVLFGVTALGVFLVWLEGEMIVSRLIESKAITNAEVILELNLLVGITGKTALLVSAVVFGLGLFLSHFVAGPVFRFEKTLEEMRDGNLGVQVRLRDHDEFKETADIFNQMLAGLRNKLKKERDSVEGLIEKARAVSESLKKSGHASEANQIDQLLAEFKNIPPQIKIG